MRILSPIVQPAPHLAAIKIAEVAHRGRVGMQPIGDDYFGLAVSLQRRVQKPQSRRFGSFLGDTGFQYLALVVDRPPEIMHLMRVTETYKVGHRS